LLLRYSKDLKLKPDDLKLFSMAGPTLEKYLLNILQISTLLVIKLPELALI